MNNNDLKRVIEALIFAADAPLTPERIRETIEACTDEELAHTVEMLNGEYEAAGHSFMIRQVAGGYQVTTRPEYSNWIKKLYLGRQKGRLSQAALESLAIIAFKQPISRVDIAQIRGVNSDAVIGTLLERKLVTISGRSDAVGRPLLYSTTPEFLEFFGINDLAELPKPREIEELIGKEGMPEDVLQALSSDKQLKLPISFEPEASPESGTPNVPLLLPPPSEQAEVVNANDDLNTASIDQNEPTTNIAAETKETLEEVSVEPETSEVEAVALPTHGTEIEASLAEAAPHEMTEAVAPRTEHEEADTNEATLVPDNNDAPVTVVSQAEVVHLLPAADDSTSAPPPAAESALVTPSKKTKDRKRGKRNEPQLESPEEFSRSALSPSVGEPAAELKISNSIAEEIVAPVVAEVPETETALIEETPKEESQPQADDTSIANLTASAPAEEFDAFALAEEDEVVGAEEETRAIAATSEADDAPALVATDPLEQVTIVAASATASFESTIETNVFETPIEEAHAFSLSNIDEAHGHSASPLTAQTMIAAVPTFADETFALADDKNAEEFSETDAWPEVTEVRFEEPVRVEIESAAMTFASAEMEAEPQSAVMSSAAPLQFEAEELAEEMDIRPALNAPEEIAQHLEATSANEAQTAELIFFV